MAHLGMGQRFITSVGNQALRFAENPTLRAINEGLISLVPIVLIGTLCVIFFSFPLPAYQDFLEGVSGGNAEGLTRLVTRGTADIIALAAMVSVSLSLVEHSNLESRREISVFVPLFTTMACYVVFFILNQPNYVSAPQTSAPEVVFAGTEGRAVFSGLFVAVAATKLFIAFDRLWQRLRTFRRPARYSNHQLRVALRSLCPLLLTVGCFALARILLEIIRSSTDIDGALYSLMTYAINNGGLGGVLISETLIQLLWFLGAHGSDSLLAFLTPEVTELLSEGIPALGGAADAAGALEAAGTAGAAEALGAASALGATGVTEAGATLHASVTSAAFYRSFVELGGPGATLGLLAAFFLFGSDARGRRVARFSLFPSLFNANEVVLYGAPVVLSPFLFIPFIAAPVLVAALSYLGFASGLIPLITATVDPFTPLFFSGYLATGSVAGSILQLMGLALSVAVYAPFVLATKYAQERHQQALYGQFKKDAAQAANNEQSELVSRRDAIGAMARDFISEIHEHLGNKCLPFFMVFQPKVDKEGKVVGAEALIRWTHPRFGAVPPDILIELADEAGVSTELGRWIATASLSEFARFQDSGIQDISLSINLNPHHLSIDASFPNFLEAEMGRLGILPSQVDLEITEHVAVGSSAAMQEMFQRLRGLGVGLSIDDMGMGYSSLTYISDFGVKTVKIDISLVNKIDRDFRQQEIVRSVLELASSLELSVIVEGVESKEQLEALVALGCKLFQGYYFSRPLSGADFCSYVSEHGVCEVIEHAVCQVSERRKVAWG